MDHVSAGDATRHGTRNRRRRMRDQARSRHAAAPVSDRYETPAWLDRSFVLPLTQPESNDVPSQAAGNHDDDPELAPESLVIPRPDADALPLSPAETPAPPPGSFVRPPSPEIDFGRVVRRSDLSRRVTRVHWVATGLAGVALVVYLLVPSVALLVAVITCAVVSVAAFAVRYRLNHAPVPRVRR